MHHMRRLLPFLLKNALFQGLNEEQLLQFLKGSLCQIKSYGAAEAVFLAGDEVRNVGIVVSGKVRIQRESHDGHVVIVGEAEAGETFAEAFVCAGMEMIPVSVWTVLPSEIFFADYRHILSEVPGCDITHSILVRNMLKITVEKLLFLSHKIDVLSKSTTRDKLITYLERFSRKSGKERFSIPLNRQELADYLGVNRSALSREMALMQAEGVLEFSKNTFRLL